MIAGVRAFAAASPIEESYAIIKHTPEPPAGATKPVARIVMRCLEKRPDDRFQSATDLAFALDELDASTESDRAHLGDGAPGLSDGAAGDGVARALGPARRDCRGRAGRGCGSASRSVD